MPDVQVEAGGIEVIEELDQVCWKCGECKPIYAFRMDPEKGWRRLKCMACEAAEVPPKVRKGDPWRPTPEDERIIADLYPTKGSAACKLLIPKATIRQIQRVAERLGIRYVGARVALPGQRPEPEFAVPAHDYTPADFAIREWRTARPVGQVFAPSLGVMP